MNQVLIFSNPLRGLARSMGGCHGVAGAGLRHVLRQLRLQRSDFAHEISSGERLGLGVEIRNTGKRDGADVIQV